MDIPGLYPFCLFPLARINHVALIAEGMENAVSNGILGEHQCLYHNNFKNCTFITH